MLDRHRDDDLRQCVTFRTLRILYCLSLGTLYQLNMTPADLMDLARAYGELAREYPELAESVSADHLAT